MVKEIKEKEKLTYISIFRGIMLCYIIMGHIGFSGVFDYYIHAFHVPVFFFISGYCFKPCARIRDYVIKKVRTLIIPYVIFALIHFGAAFFLVENFNWEMALRSIFWKNNSALPISGSIWFLTSIFTASVIFQIMEKTTGGWLEAVIAIALFVAGYICPIRLPYSSDTALIGIIFMYMGRMLRMHEHEKERLNKILNSGYLGILCILALQIVGVAANGYVNMRKMHYGNPVLFIINVILAYVLYINISKKLENIHWSIGKKAIGILVHIGDESIYFLAFNELAIKLWMLFVPIYEGENALFKLGYKLAEMGSVLAFCFAICFAVKYCAKLMYEFGRKE